MKKLLFSFLLFFPILIKAQVTSVASKSFGTIADLRAQVGADNVQVLLQGLTSTDDNNGGLYMWKPASTDTDDGFVTIKVTGVTTGRWRRVGNGNTIKFSKTLSGAALQTAYSVLFDSTLPFVPITIIINPRSSSAAVPSWISSITNTGFTINFASIPVLGTNNIVFDVIAIKQ